MKLTPLEIQQMVFQVRMRGYDRDEVNRFLEEVAQAVEAVNRDNAILRERVQSMEQQVTDLKRNEATLSNTLLSAQSMADDVRKSAQREADLVQREAELKASELLRQAQTELADTQRDIMELRKQRLLMIERFRATVRTFDRMLEVEEAEELDEREIDAARSEAAAAKHIG
ncbi:MAG: DivIVA domain-containing protein [Nitrospiraceae bacterium]